MKRKSLLGAFILGTCTIVLQLPHSVSQETLSASAWGPVSALADKSAAVRTTRPRAAIPRKALSPASRRQLLGTVASARPSPSAVAPVVYAVGIRDPLAAVVKPDITPAHQELSRKVLGILPADCQASLKNYYVLYNDPSHRGLAGDGTIIMNGAIDDRQFVEMLVHEGLGHLWDISCLTGTKSAGPSAFRDGETVIHADDPSVGFYSISWLSSTKRHPESRESDFVSRYAPSNPFEDMAETVAEYVLNGERFRARADSNPILARKLAWMEQHFPLARQIASGSRWDGVIPDAAARGVYELSL